MSDNSSSDFNFVFYYYGPSSAAAGIFLALFGLSSLLHFYQLVRTRTWFMIPFLIGGLMETIGYIGRLLSSLQTPNFTKGPYIIQSALLLIAPAFFAASIYMTLGRIIQMVQGEKYSVIKPRWVTTIFVCGDVLSFLMQASGAGLMVTNTNNVDIGERVIIGGLLVQIIIFGFFVITASVFQMRISKNPSARSMELDGLWKGHMTTLYVASVFILVRSVVRVVEYIEGYQGYLMKHEVFIYVFDALLMFIVMLVLNYSHPSEINCLLGRGDRFSEKAIFTRKAAPGSVHETSDSMNV